MRKVGEDVTEILDYIPGHFEVIKHIRPAFSCRRCESMVQTPIRCSVSMSLGRCARSNRMRKSYQRCVIAVTSRIASRVKKSRLSGGLRLPRAHRHPPIDAFQQHAELGRRECCNAVRRRGPNKATLLQPLRKQAEPLSVPPQRFEQISTAPAEHKNLAAKRIAPQIVLHRMAKPSKPLRLCPAPHKRNYVECTIMLSPRRLGEYPRCSAVS